MTIKIIFKQYHNKTLESIILEGKIISCTKDLVITERAHVETRQYWYYEDGIEKIECE